VPEQFETNRLLLRAPQNGDGVMINEAIRDSYEYLHKWLKWADHIPEVEETEAILVNIGRIFYCVIHLHFTYLINFPEYKAAYCNRFSCRQYCYNTIGGRSLEKSIYHTG